MDYFLRRLNPTLELIIICIINLKSTAMNDEQLKGKWNQLKGKLKQKYGNLTDDDLTYSEGRFDEMFGRIQEKTGKRKDELKRELESY
ncbi:uncharacterized protein YjbJ (UPF0337 family) [Zeaxanthinibacter enoshimensis]|uniref:Uncharacterized protein YjbJ (UPF0337 family) n=2 Tax=Zeaxanthinibacter enoshimensis TaxID=392009 RepID=A0A4R6TM55_9FLAO|nr:uncharacterized protein YjbJ (UPF0337 family) [Zeaxanthinibacter enoshimensis]